MADCTLVRCVQEKKIFKKEFQKWNKDVLLILGLERIAEELMGSKKWKILTKPFTELEPAEASNWDPGQNRCWGPHQEPEGLLDDDHSTSSDTPPGGAPPLNGGDQPLDLSFKSSRPLESEEEEPEEGNEDTLKVPQLGALKSSSSSGPQRKRLDGAIKKSYTEEELQAALRDIQSGRLGTRRAAVLYGIPRSTLRNKVYKLAAAGNPRPLRSSSSAAPARTPMVSSSLRQLLKSTISQKLNHRQAAAAEPLLSQVFSNIHHLALTANNHKSVTASLTQDVPLLPDLIKRLAAEQLENRANLNNVILKIPSYKSVPPPADSPPPPVSPTPSQDSESSPHARSRPKRGRYRNYDRDNLARAVRAVQRGEMSVHRAGTFFGVPHSTLEYKVKERHLMRPKKKRDTPGSSDSPPSKPSSLWQTVPFFSLANSNNYFASQMMRKLQAEVTAKHSEGDSPDLLETLIKTTLERRH